MASLLPGRMAATVLTNVTDVPRSFGSPVLAAILIGRVVLVAPRGAGRSQKLVQRWGGRGLRGSHVIPLVVEGSSSNSSSSSSSWRRLLAWLPPGRRLLAVSRGIHAVALALLVRSPVWEGAVVVEVVRVAVFMRIGRV